MKKSAGVILAIISLGIGLYSGFIIPMYLIVYIFKFLEIIIGANLEAMWMLIMILAFCLGIGGGILGAVLLWKISWGKFNSEQWKINRYVIILLVLIVGIVAYYLTKI